MVAADIRGRGVRDPCVLGAMGRIARERFVPERSRHEAYADRPLPIGFEQTISQPYIVALMTAALELRGEERVLEIGTGSGYQAAVLAECARQVFTIEINAALARAAEERLAALDYGRVQVHHGDGRAGWPAHAPYDAIVVTAAGPEVPQPLIDQLREGGRLIMPRGEAGGLQALVLGVKRDGRLDIREIAAVSFVPLLGGATAEPQGGPAGGAAPVKR
jgi:protein-L-isoaspartate(D-aspartate) O-methyltransferase